MLIIAAGALPSVAVPACTCALAGAVFLYLSPACHHPPQLHLSHRPHSLMLRTLHACCLRLPWPDLSAWMLLFCVPPASCPA